MRDYCIKSGWYSVTVREGFHVAGRVKFCLLSCLSAVSAVEDIECVDGSNLKLSKMVGIFYHLISLLVSTFRGDSYFWRLSLKPTYFLVGLLIGG